VFTGFWLGGPKIRDHWEDLGVGGKLTLRWTLWSRDRLAQDRVWLLFDKLSNYRLQTGSGAHPAPIH